MKHFFGITSMVIEHMFKFFVYQVTLLYSNIVNKVFIISTFLLFRYSYMGAKSGLLKNIIIHFFIILLISMNFAYVYSILFFNWRQSSSSISDILSMLVRIFSYSTSYLACLLWILPNLINLKLLWVDWSLDLNQKKMFYILFKVTFAISITSTISNPIRLPALLVYTTFFLLKQVISICINLHSVNKIVVLGICSINGIVTLRMVTKRLSA